MIISVLQFFNILKLDYKKPCKNIYPIIFYHIQSTWNIPKCYYEDADFYFFGFFFFGGGVGGKQSNLCITTFASEQIESCMGNRLIKKLDKQKKKKKKSPRSDA